MGFIYYIYNIKNSGALYIGQDSLALNPYDLNGRIFQHAAIAYGLQTGPFYGAEQLMLENSLSNIGVTIANLSDPCWQTAFQQFSRYWDFIPDGASTDPMINFAEMASIFVYKNRDNLKVVNVQEGGYQSKWVCKKERLLSYSKLASQYQAFISQDKFEDVIIDPFRGTGAGLKLFAPQIYQLYRLFTIVLQKGLFFDSNKKLHPEFIQVIVDSLTQLTAQGSRVEVNTEVFHKKLVQYVSDQWKKMCTTLAQDYNNQELLNIPEPKWNFHAFISRFTTWFNKRINTAIGSAQSIVLNALQNKKNSKEQVFGGKQLYSIPASSFANEETMQLIANSVSSVTSKTYLQSPFGAWLRTLYNSLPLKLHHNENIALRLRTISYKYFQKLYDKTIENAQYPSPPQPYLGFVMKKINDGTLIDRLETQLDITGLWQYSNVYLRQMLTYHLKKLGRSIQDTETFDGDIEYLSSHETAPGFPEPDREYGYISSRGIMYAFKPSTWQRILNYQNLDLQDISFY